MNKLIKVNFFKMKYFISIIAILSVIGLSSCKKCLDCSYTYTEGEYENTYTYQQYCGSKKNRVNFEEMVKYAAQEHSGTYVCHESKD